MSSTDGASTATTRTTGIGSTSPADAGAGAPVAQVLAVALTAEEVRLLERDLLRAGQVEPIPVVRVVAVEAPSVLLIVREHDVAVHVGERPAHPVDLQARVAARARENAIGERGRWNLHPLFSGGGAGTRQGRRRGMLGERHLSL